MNCGMFEFGIEAFFTGTAPLEGWVICFVFADQREAVRRPVPPPWSPCAPPPRPRT